MKKKIKKLNNYNLEDAIYYYSSIDPIFTITMISMASENNNLKYDYETIYRIYLMIYDMYYNFNKNYNKLGKKEFFNQLDMFASYIEDRKLVCKNK